VDRGRPSPAPRWRSSIDRRASGATPSRPGRATARAPFNSWLDRQRDVGSRVRSTTCAPFQHPAAVGSPHGRMRPIAARRPSCRVAEMLDVLAREKTRPALRLRRRGRGHTISRTDRGNIRSSTSMYCLSSPRDASLRPCVVYRYKHSSPAPAEGVRPAGCGESTSDAERGGELHERSRFTSNLRSRARTRISSAMSQPGEKIGVSASRSGTPRLPLPAEEIVSRECMSRDHRFALSHTCGRPPSWPKRRWPSGRRRSRTQSTPPAATSSLAVSRRRQAVHDVRTGLKVPVTGVSRSPCSVSVNANLQQRIDISETQLRCERLPGLTRRLLDARAV